MTQVAFKDRLKLLRNERGMTQEDLANALGLPSSTIRRYESSEAGNPKNERLQLIADYFDCTVDYLLERTDNKRSQTKHKINKDQSDHVLKELINKYNIDLNEPGKKEKLEQIIQLVFGDMKK